MPNQCWPGNLEPVQDSHHRQCQSIKNPDSRSQAVKKYLANVPHRIAMSGSAIMNAAHEYFPVLNWLRPGCSLVRRLRQRLDEWAASHEPQQFQGKDGLHHPQDEG
jgi:hypothetical protein